MQKYICTDRNEYVKESRSKRRSAEERNQRNDSNKITKNDFGNNQACSTEKNSEIIGIFSHEISAPRQKSILQNDKYD